MIEILNILKLILVIPNIPLIFALVIINKYNKVEFEDDEHLGEYIASLYPEWLYNVIGIIGWIWIINLIL